VSTLLLRLSAPLQSWGSDSKYDRRSTERAPTKSGIVGLVAAALGRKRNEGIEDLASLGFGVRTDRAGVLLRDYHTAKSAKSAYVTHRYYLSDAVFLVGLEGDHSRLLEIERALKAPRFPLFLGRRSCPPEGRISLGLRDLPLREALQSEPPLVKNRHSRDKSGTHALRISIDAQADGFARFVRDVPLSFDQRRREYGFRSMQEYTILQGEDEAEPSTLHDPMEELEG
jgi:CRISPR system Cascade subunit CasD